MQFVIKHSVLLTMALMLFSIGCKEKDDIKPELDILSPSEGTIYQVFDTIQVELIATDETELGPVSIKLVNADLIAVGPSTTVSVQSSNGAGTGSIVIADKLLPTGDYYVLATAIDAQNETRAYRKIRIVELPKKRRAVYLASGDVTSKIWKTDSLLQSIEQWIDPAQDILELNVNSLNDRLVLIGNYSSGIRGYDIQTQAQLWSDQVFPVNQIQRFTDLFTFENTSYVSIYDREVRSYSLSGDLRMNETTGNFRPETIYADESFILVEMNLVGDGTHFIYVYNALTRVLLWQLQLPMNIESVCNFGNGKVMFFGNDNGQARVLQYDVNTNNYWEPRQLPSGTLTAAVKLTGQVYAIAHENGLYSYTYSPNYLNLINAGTLYQQLQYDVDRGTILASTDNVLQELSNNGQVLNSLVHSESIISFDVHYTR